MTLASEDNDEHDEHDDHDDKVKVKKNIPVCGDVLMFLFVCQLVFC